MTTNWNGITTNYVVMNENTLGYISSLDPQHMGVLHGSALRGGHDWMNGDVHISQSDVIRPATLVDFKSYRVAPPPSTN